MPRPLFLRRKITACAASRQVGNEQAANNLGKQSEKTIKGLMISVLKPSLTESVFHKSEEMLSLLPRGSICGQSLFQVCLSAILVPTSIFWAKQTTHLCYVCHSFKSVPQCRVVLNFVTWFLYRQAYWVLRGIAAPTRNLRTVFKGEDRFHIGIWIVVILGWCHGK